VATLLVDLVRRSAPDRRITAYSFRAVSPLFDGSEARVNGTPPDADGVVKLWANNAAGRVTMTAEATLA
jgi:3-methylfumaryl-CoA hydratase